MKILELILPLALKLIHSWLGKAEENKKAEQDWVKFIERMDEVENNSKRLTKTIKELKNKNLS